MSGYSGFKNCYKVWLEKEGAVFGEGLYRLLSNIKSTGSLSCAAADLGMSYRAAWGKIRMAEKKWGIRLIETRVGGEAGGGTRLTGEAEVLVEEFAGFQTRIDDLVRRTDR